MCFVFASNYLPYSLVVVVVVGRCIQCNRFTCIYYFLNVQRFILSPHPPRSVQSRSEWCIITMNLMQFELQLSAAHIILQMLRPIQNPSLLHLASVCVHTNDFRKISVHGKFSIKSIYLVCVSQFIVNICTISCCYDLRTHTHTRIHFVFNWILLLIGRNTRRIDSIWYCMQMGFCLNFSVSQQNWNKIVLFSLEFCLNCCAWVESGKRLWLRAGAVRVCTFLCKLLMMCSMFLFSKFLFWKSNANE